MTARETFDLPKTVRLDGAEVSVATFLAYCVDDDETHLPPRVVSDAKRHRRVFIEGGLEAMLASQEANARWIQIGLQTRLAAPPGLLYIRLAEVARESLDHYGARNVFFMHKPPGIRLRLEARKGQQENLKSFIHAHANQWRDEKLIERVIPAVYEPETRLFGGAKSMRMVHRLFTIDSLAWLDYHAWLSAQPDELAPAWVLSLAMLREVFVQLAIIDWEDIDVWDRIRSKTGRSLPSQVLPPTALEAAAKDICSHWLDPQVLLTELPGEVRKVAERYNRAIPNIVGRWRRAYFDSEDASIGTRAAAALLTIFHWNRAGLPPMRQTLLAEALASRDTI